MATGKDRSRAGRGRPLRIAGKVARRAVRKLDDAQARWLGEPPMIARRRPIDGPPAVGAAREAFFRVLEQDGDIALAAITVVREYIACGASRRSRIFAQLLQQERGGVREAGDICMAVLSLRNERVAATWQLLQGVSLGEALRLAPMEFFESGFAIDPETAVKALDAVTRGEHTIDVRGPDWLRLAGLAFARGAEDVSRFALDQARGRAASLPKEQARHLRVAADWLERWYGRAEAAAKAQPPPDGEIPVAVLNYRQPERDNSSANLGDYLGTLAVLDRLAHVPGVRFAGEPEVAALIHGVPPGPASSRTATVRLYEVDRDATSYAAVPDGTWVVVTGMLPRTIFGVRRDLPFNRRLRPIFLSVHVDSVDLLTPETIEYLRRFGPIGCHDWSTVFLLEAACVPAFFAGPVAATLDASGPPAATGREGVLFVDTPATGNGDTSRQIFAGVRDRGLAANLDDARRRVQDYAAKYRMVVTSQPETYFAARSVGAAAQLLPGNRSERRFDGLLDLDDAALAAVRRGITVKLDAVYTAVLAGSSEREVYARWRDVTAASVAEAEQRRAEVPPPPRPGFDVQAACAAIRSAAVTAERAAPGPEGGEINVEMSLDGNYRHQLEVVLDSIVTHASRPIRAFVLCRDNTRADYHRMAALFPTVSFVWLPTDGVNYGTLSGLISHTTVATLDRLLLPDLLPDVDRTIHHDLDALCLADLAELYDVDLAGAPIAGRTSPHPNRVSGYASVLRRSERFRSRPELGRELIRRTHSRLPFDFPVFNAGILVLDLARMRRDGFTREFLPYVERFGMHDQEVLNLYAGSERVALADAWNWLPWLETVDDPKIAHWAGDFKPWQDSWVAGRDLWRLAEARLAARYERAGLG